MKQSSAHKQGAQRCSASCRTPRPLASPLQSFARTCRAASRPHRTHPTCSRNTRADRSFVRFATQGSTVRAVGRRHERSLPVAQVRPTLEPSHVPAPLGPNRSRGSPKAGTKVRSHSLCVCHTLFCSNGPAVLAGRKSVWLTYGDRHRGSRATAQRACVTAQRACATAGRMAPSRIASDFSIHRTAPSQLGSDFLHSSRPPSMVYSAWISRDGPTRVHDGPTCVRDDPTRGAIADRQRLFNT